MAGILMTDPGFGRGHTLGVTDPEQGTSVTGTQKAFTDSDPRTTNASQFYSNRPVTCLAMRNTTGSAALPGTVVTFSATDVLNAFDNTGDLQGVVDEYLPATGCENNDVCWVVVSGPTAIATAATFAPGDGVNADGTVGDGSADIGVAIEADEDGFVRTLVGTISEHALN